MSELTQGQKLLLSALEAKREQIVCDYNRKRFARKQDSEGNFILRKKEQEDQM